MSSRVPELAVFLPELEAGGAQHVILDLLRNFRENRLDVDLVLAQATGALLPRVPEGVTVIVLSSAQRVRSRAELAIRSVLGLRRYLRQRRPTAVLSTLTGANLVSVLARYLSGVPTRIILREASSLDNASSRWLRTAMRLIYPRADAVIAVSNNVARDLIDEIGVVPSRVLTIPNPIDIASARRYAKEAVPHPWFDPGAPPVILGVGRLTPAKDFETLLRAFALVRSRIDARLMVLGDGPLRGALEALVHSLRLGAWVSMPGYVSNPYAYMQRAALLVLSSRWEGFPNVLLQALSVGLPIVATDCPGGNAEILQNGRLGRLVPVGDAEALAAAIILALKSPSNSALMLEATNGYDLATIASRYLSVLRGTPKLAEECAHNVTRK